MGTGCTVSISIAIYLLLHFFQPSDVKKVFRMSLRYSGDVGYTKICGGNSNIMVTDYNFKLYKIKDSPCSTCKVDKGESLFSRYDHHVYIHKLVCLSTPILSCLLKLALSDFLLYLGLGDKVERRADRSM